MSKIFISYRRDDSPYAAGQIYKALEEKFGKKAIFKDNYDVNGGDKWAESIKQALDQCQVLLVVIGKDWLQILQIKDDSEKRRLDDPRDWVRFEIVTALDRKIKVIPLLLDGVKMPPVNELPSDLESLTNYQGLKVRQDPDFDEDMKRVITVIQDYLKRLQPSTIDFVVELVNVQGKVIDRQSQAKYYCEELGNGVSLDLVKIPAGTFQMGSPKSELGRLDREDPQHSVTVSGFWMGMYPVTQAQWRVVASFAKVKHDLEPDPSHFKGDNRPVEKISWHDALEFCARLSQKTGREYRLPSEAEWEYACRAGTTTPFHFGPTITTDLANYRGKDYIYEGKSYSGFYGDGPKGEYREETTPVGYFKAANPFGLYDMHGNVWEWCLDYWHNSYQGAPTDGSAWLTGGDDSYRLLRGGSWDDIPGICRSAYRIRLNPDFRNSLVGLRIVCRSARTS